MDPNAISNVEKQIQQQQQAQEMAERKSMILDQIMEPGARERISRMGMVRPDKARAVEDSLIMAAQNGRLKSKVTEEQLIAMVDQISGSADGGSSGSAPLAKPKSIQFQRRRNFDDEDDDDDDDI